MLTPAGRLNVLLSLQRFERAVHRPRLVPFILSVILWAAIAFAVADLL